MADTFFDKKVTTRKPHRCYGCGRRFPPGTMMTRIEAVDQGGWIRSYWCAVCEEVMRIQRGYYWDEMDIGAVREDDIWEETRAKIEDANESY